MARRACDLVLEGGGVKGIALVGALEELDAAGFDRCRVAGTSAGAIVGSLVAAGIPITKLRTLMQTLDYTKFRDESFLSQFSWPGKAASLIFTKGIYQGKYLHDWLSTELAKLGVRTFADLLITEPWAKDLPPEQRYRLVIITSDVTTGRMVRLPWDYAEYGLDPNTQSVADAVRTSMSIPYFYQPARLNRNFLVDGGLLSNFPIDIFDSMNDWPTIGVKLSAKSNTLDKTNKVTNPVDYTLAIMGTATNAHDLMHIDDPCAQMRTIFVDTFNIKATDFGITEEQQGKLYGSGKQYAQAFLKTWDFAAYQKACPMKPTHTNKQSQRGKS